tara:strand:+ start:11398 stop:12249 length:852 start_codon:yes stop_codon:yes gene_type:complete
MLVWSVDSDAARGEPVSTVVQMPEKSSALVTDGLESDLPILKICGFDWAPYSYHEGSATVGVLIDLLKRAELNHELQFNFMPLQRCLAAVRQGYQDMILYSSTPHDQLVMVDTVVQYHVSGVIVGSQSKHQSFEGLTQFSGETLGVLRGNPIFQSLKHYQGIQWELQNTGKSMWQMLMRGRLDAAIGDYLSVTPLEVYRQGDVRFLQPALYVVPIRMAVNISKAQLVPGLNQRLAQMLEKGTVDHLYRRHGVEPFSRVQTMVDEFHQRQREKTQKARDMAESP